MTTNNHEVIFVIVNQGFAEEAMDVAREQGVRGGTILNARGVAREKEAAFFGITIQLLGFRAIISRKVAEHRAMRRILDADDQQIINFM